MTGSDHALALSVPDAAAAVGMSTEALRNVIRRGDLTVLYPTARPVVLVTELQAWVESLPTTRNRDAS